MKLAIDQLLLLGLFSTAIHWLVARSEIARPLWSRTSGWLDKLLRCPACSGYWLGGLITWGGVHPFGDTGTSWWMFVFKTQLAGLAAMVLTPIFEGVMVWGLRESAIEAPTNDTIDAQAGEINTPDPGLLESGEVTPNERPR